MDSRAIVRTVGYITGGTVLVVGCAILLGSIVPNYIPENFRILVGLVLVLYGLYRPLMIWTKQKNERRLERREE